MHISTKTRLALSTTLFCVFSQLLAEETQTAEPVVVYSARKTQLVEHVFKAYTEKTGTPIQLHTDKAGPLLQKLLAEGEKTKADLLLTVDAGNLWNAAERGVVQAIDSEVLKENIPASYRDAGDRWFGLSLRARVIVYNSDRVQPGELGSYEDLAKPQWRGRLVLRTSKKVYNQSLVASMIERIGRTGTMDTLKGWVRNLAAPVYAKDSKALEAVAAGQGDVTLVNTYYYARLMKDQPELPLKIFWPNQGPNQGGVHVNVSGAGVVRHADNPEGAQALLEWLSSEEAQNLFADVNAEFPVNPKVEASELVRSWGDFRPDPTNLAVTGQRQKEAILLMDFAGYR